MNGNPCLCVCLYSRVCAWMCAQVCLLQYVCILAVWQDILQQTTLSNDWLYLALAINHTTSAPFNHLQTHTNAETLRHKQKHTERTFLTSWTTPHMPLANTHVQSTALYLTSSTHKGQAQMSDLDRKTPIALSVSMLSTMPLRMLLYGIRWHVCVLCEIISPPLTNVFALHVIVEGDAVWDSAGALGAPDWRHIEKWRQKTGLVPLSTRSWCFDVHVVPCHQPENIKQL